MHMLSTLPGEAVPAPLMPWPMPWRAEEIFSLAAGSQVNQEKPHQGATGKNPGLHPGATACNSTTALGVSWGQWSGTMPGATVTYEYDAFGNSFTVSGSTPNEMMYRGEQYDSGLGLYYLRARYYNPATGRFMSRDPEDGKPIDPKTLHKYLYVGGDPVNGVDPRGRELVEYEDEMTVTTRATVNVFKLRRAIQYSECVIAGLTYLAANWSPDPSWLSWEEELFLEDAINAVKARCLGLS